MPDVEITILPREIIGIDLIMENINQENKDGK